MNVRVAAAARPGANHPLRVVPVGTSCSPQYRRTMNTGKFELRLRHFVNRGKRQRRNNRFFGIALALLAFCPWGHSQSNPTLPQGPPSGNTDADAITLSRRVDEVDVVFTAWAHNHSVVSDLAARDIEVFDNSKEPTSIVRFESSSDLPLTIGI